MKQVTQRMKNGRVEVLDVPAPVVSPEGVLVDIRASLLSAGTERTKIQAGRKNLVQKARSRPDQVALVLEKARRDGLKETVAAVRTRLDEPSVLGYSAAGVVLEVGPLVRDIAPGDRVACGGAGAVHADVDLVPGNLCVKLPDSVDFVEGAFATVGAIAMHAVRQADVRLGERIAVIGQGLVGQLAGMLLRASGCTVVGVDLDEALLDRARASGAVDVAVSRETLDPKRLPPDIGECDAVLITAATRSDDPVALAAALCRDRGRVVVVGDVGLQIPRAPYYDKEIDLRLSRSYGPGRYDRTYEEHGIDYPIGYVRWTERRNMQAFVDLLGARRLDITSLITERIAVLDAPAAYARLATSTASPLGIVIEYSPTTPQARPSGPAAQPGATASNGKVGLIGAGSFASRIIVPGLTAAGFEIVSVASATGLSAASAAERLPGARAVSADAVIDDPQATLVAIATRHGSHAELGVRALNAGKAVYVEKPPCLSRDELTALRQARIESGQSLFVGFNRRHAPLVTALKEHIATTAGHPAEIVIRINAGTLPAGHWLNDLAEGGGRLLGEGCHFVDLASWIVGMAPERVSCTVRPRNGETVQTAQRFSISLEFSDDSLATIIYTDGGASGLGKELIEAHAGGRSAILDDFRSLELRHGGKRRRLSSRTQDKGHRRQFVALRETLDGVSATPPLDPLQSMVATIAALEAAGDGRSRPVELERLDRPRVDRADSDLAHRDEPQEPSP